MLTGQVTHEEVFALINRHGVNKANGIPAFVLKATGRNISSLMNKHDVNKANGYNCIPAFVLKATTRSISSPLAQLFYLSLSSGKFPEMLKIAIIVPIPKSVD